MILGVFEKRIVPFGMIDIKERGHFEVERGSIMIVHQFDPIIFALCFQGGGLRMGLCWETPMSSSYEWTWWEQVNSQGRVTLGDGRLR